MTDYSQHFNTKKTSQAQPIPGREDQVKNSAGGYVFAVAPEVRLQRFLILGTEGGSYYASERDLTLQNANHIIQLAKELGVGVVKEIVEIATARPARAPKMSPSIFALAVCATQCGPEVRAAALGSLAQVCRIPTHLFEFIGAYKNLGGGWGRSFKRAVANWYLERKPETLAYHMVKYQNRGGWSNRDVLRLAHPTPNSPAQQDVFKWVINGTVPEAESGEVQAYLVHANELMRGDVTRNRAVELIQQFGFTREMVPTQFQKDPEVWEALLQRMPIGATIRNLNRMTACGLLKPLSDGVAKVVESLNNDALRRGRIHPVNLLIAKMTYEQGRGARGSLTWKPVPQITAALEDAFHRSFGTVEPTGKRFLLGLDVSGSMGWGAGMMGLEGLTPSIASTCMAMVPLRTEPNSHVMAFTGNFQDPGITSRDSLAEAVRKVSGLRFGRTDCALPMIWAAKNGVKVDTFVIYTDNETWFGSNGHPCQALEAYRQKSGINAALVVNGMTATNFTIADPKDPKQLDVVGFDTNVPHLIREVSMW